jgi:hypothetical protein
MNKLEAAYAQRLGEYGLEYHYEAITLKLAFNTRYTPDFLVIGNDDVVEFHETKGFRREDAIVKLKVAAAKFPWFRFLLCERKAGLWVTKEIKAA